MIAGMIREAQRDAEVGRFAPQKLAEAEAKREADELKAEDERTRAILGYAAKAIGDEMAGASRFSPDDVNDGVGAMLDGQKPAPKGQVFSLPSETV
jgi:hypothetical protein